MELKFDVDAITPQMTLAAMLANAKTTIAILDNVYCEPYFDGQDPRMVVTASDGETWLTLNVRLLSLQGEDEKPFLLEAKRFMNTLRKLAGEQVTMVIDDQKKSITGKYANGHFTQPLIQSDDFPTYEKFETQIAATCESKNIIDAISKVSFAASTDQLRPVFCGVRIDFKEDGLVAAATDTHILVKHADKEVKCEKEKTFGFTLASRPAQILAKVASGYDGSLQVNYNEGNVEITAPHFTLSARTINAKYPNYESVIPKDNNIIVNVNKNDFTRAINRVLTFGNENISLVVLSLSNGVLKVSAQNLDFATSAEEQIAVRYDGEQISMGANGENLLVLLQHQDGEEVSISLKDKTSAGVIVPIGEEDYTQIFMPMQYQ